MKELSADKLPIGRLLSKDYFFSVPNYQRPFSWEQAHFEDLIDDLITAEDDTPYFLGTFVLHNLGKDKNFDLVDGQQRLTSLLILLACLRDAVENPEYKRSTHEKIVEPKNVVDGIAERQRLVVRDRQQFDALVVKLGGTLETPEFKSKPDPLRRYLIAIQVFRDRIAKLDQTSIERLISFISQKCVGIVLTTEQFDEAFKLFAVVNDRGKQLRRIDVLKATNISPDLISNAQIREQIADDWESLENELGEDVFETIFYLLRLSLLKDKPQGDLLKEFEDRLFKPKIISRGQPFLDRVFAYADTYRRIFVDKDILSPDAPNYNKFRAMIYIMDAEFKASEWRAVLVSYAERFGSNGLYDFILKLERIYLDHWLNAVRKDERYSTYSKLLNSIETAQNPQSVIDSIAIDAEQLKESIVQSRAYGSSYCKYILLRLEVSVSEHDKVNEFSASSIEHVLPQNPKEDSDWLKIHDASKMDEYVHSFGNLVLLSKSKNSSANNHELSDKQKRYLAQRVSDYPRSIQVLDATEWTKETILARTLEAADLVLSDP